MSRVSHFQRFSQPENHATNNTMLVLRYFYQSSPFKIEGILNSLVDAQFNIGLTFRQQIKGSNSVPDALISQQSFQLFFETKRGGELDVDQIQRHLKSIHDSSGANVGRQQAILVGLTKEPIPDSQRALLRESANALGISFASVTFSQLVEALKAECQPYERDLISIVNDYEAYLSEERLLEESNRWLVVFPCGTSYIENLKFGIYYELDAKPSKRNYHFIGVYRQKTVTHVGRVQSIIVTTWQDDKVTFTLESGASNPELQQRILDTINQTPYYDLKSEPFRFYLVDSFLPTDIRKTSPSGIMGFRYLDLAKLIRTYNPSRHYSTVELAETLKGSTWE